MSVFGDLKYPADFQHFDYVNLAAPKGGLFSLIPSARAYNQSFFTFNSLNAYILKGEGAQGMDMTFATLMARASDEPDAVYGLGGEVGADFADKLTYRFTMRPEARFHDGSKLTAQDVAFSLTTLKEKGHPLIMVQLRDMVKAEAPDDATVVVTFRRSARATCRSMSRACRSSPRPITPRGRSMNRRSILPLGSGPYKVGKFEVNRYIEYDRVKDWWAADLPVNRGSYQFRHRALRILSRSRRRVRRLFSGKSYLYREEFTSRIWATRYDFPAVKDGRVKRETLAG